jgi:hypothetical protein
MENQQKPKEVPDDEQNGLKHIGRNVTKLKQCLFIQQYNGTSVNITYKRTNLKSKFPQLLY